MNYTDEWEEYREPLARIFREVKKALPDWKQGQVDPNSLHTVILNDTEVRPEIENLIRFMIAEIEND